MTNSDSVYLTISLVCLGGLALVGLIFALVAAVGKSAAREQRQLEDVSAPGGVPAAGSEAYIGMAAQQAWENRAAKNTEGAPKTMGREKCQAVSRMNALAVRQLETDELLDRELRNYRMRHDDNAVEVGDL